MKQVKWKFKGTDVYFVNPEPKMTSAVLKQAHRLGIDPTKTKIEIVNEYFTLTDDLAGCNTCNGNSTNPAQPTIQVDNQKTQAEQTASNLLHMSRILDELRGRDSDGDEPNLHMLGGRDDGLDG